MYTVVNVVAGAVLLLAGRKLFWLFVAIAGFYVGFEVARAVFTNQPQWLVWLVAAAAGVIGALVAMLFQRVAFALGGFYAGGYLALVAAERYLPGAAGAGAFIVGGVAGAIAAALVMDWAVVILSCLVGAALVVSSLALGDLVGLLAYAGLVAIGIVVQRQLLRGHKRTPAPS
jgi:Domain of unknown function (DUF4203)